MKKILKAVDSFFSEVLDLTLKSFSQMMGKHHNAVKKIFWDIEIDGELVDKCFTRCYYKKTPKGRERWSTHESLIRGQSIGINCVVPYEIDDEDFWTLLQIAGKYKGLSPWQPGTYGHYEVVSIRPRRVIQELAKTEKKDTD